MPPGLISAASHTQPLPSSSTSRCQMSLLDMVVPRLFEYRSDLHNAPARLLGLINAIADTALGNEPEQAQMGLTRPKISLEPTRRDETSGPRHMGLLICSFNLATPTAMSFLPMLPGGGPFQRPL